jgi:hypothetical protein
MVSILYFVPIYLQLPSRRQKAVLTSPSSVNGSIQSRRASNASKHGMDSITPETIAYICVLVCITFTVSLLVTDHLLALLRSLRGFHLHHLNAGWL